MTEKITLRQAKQWRDENDAMRQQILAMRAELDQLQAHQQKQQEASGTFSLFAALAVWCFFGVFGLHRFYTRDNNRGAALLVSFVFVVLTAGLWAIVHVPWFVLDGACLFSDKRARR